MKLFLILLLVCISTCQIVKGISKSIPYYQEKRSIMDLVSSNTVESISVEYDTPFRIELPSNPTTGYSWELSKNDFVILTSSDSTANGEFTQPNSGNQGAPSTQIFSFVGKSKGEETLKFVYRRSWEAYSEDTTYEIKVTIE